MFKFIHTADIHLDSPLKGLARYEGAPTDRIRGATREAFTNLIQTAIDTNVDFVIIAGDLFDGDWQDYNTGLFFLAQMAKLREQGIQVFIVSGNHDAAGVITRQLHPPENVYAFAADTPETVRLDDIGVALHGQSFAQKEITTNLAEDYPSALPGYYNIGVLHTALNGRPGHAAYAPCNITDLLSKGYEYWALGHVHQPETVNESPWIVFPGVIQGRHIRETGAKGCTLVTVGEDRVTAVAHQTLDVLRWRRVEADITGIHTDNDLVEKVAAVLENASQHASNRLLAVRLEITGETARHSQLQADHEHWRNQVRALATDIGAGEMWLEKVIFNTRPCINIDQLARENSPIGHLLQFIDEVEADAQQCAALAELLVPLKAGLPYEVRKDSEGLDWENPQLIHELLVQARALLIPRLIEHGNTE